MFLEFSPPNRLKLLSRNALLFWLRVNTKIQAKWYNGLITEWNMESEVLLSPDNYDRIHGFRIYDVTCDDAVWAALHILPQRMRSFRCKTKSMFLIYIKNFVWGGLQRTAEETYPYGVYGIPDWKTNRTSGDTGRNGQLHIGGNMIIRM